MGLGFKSLRDAERPENRPQDMGCRADRTNVQVHYTNSGAIRIGLSERNIVRLLAKPMALQCGDFYEDGQPITGVFICEAWNKGTFLMHRREPARMISLSAQRSLLEAMLKQVQSGASAESPLAPGIILYAEADTFHYANREPGQ